MFWVKSSNWSLVLFFYLHSVVMCGASPGTLVTWLWRRLSMTYCCAERLSSPTCVTCRSWRFPDMVALSCCAGEGCLGPERWRHTYEMDMEHFANPSLSVVVAKYCFLGFVVWDRTYMCSVFTQPWPRWQDFLMFTNINGCCAGRGCACLFHVCGWFEWPSSGVVVVVVVVALGTDW